MESKVLTRAWLVWGAVSLLSLMQFFLQTSGNMLQTDLIQTFHINEAQVGLLFSTFFWAYMLVQIPAGILLDLFGSRRILMITGGLLAFGCFMFGTSTSFEMALISRLVMGVGAGFGFIGMVFAISESFPGKMFPMVLGLGELVGMVGSGIGQHFAPEFVITYGWRYLILAAGVVVCAIVILMFFVMQDRPERNRNRRNIFREIYSVVNEVVRIPVVWIAGLFCLGTFAVLTAFVDVWGVMFMQSVHGFTYLQATKSMVWVLMGIALGGPVLGWISGRFNNVKQVMVVCSFVTLIMAALLLFFNFKTLFIYNVVMFVMGFCSCSYLLSFAVVKNIVKPRMIGAATAFCNSICQFGAVVFQPLTGWLLVSLPDSELKYQYALLCFPIAVLIALIASFFVKHRQVETARA